ncbi:tripartite tricarboxylate transporter substrate binding protein [Pigmentiphaga sp. GD03639]|uniref:Bug family tripartite tricarboxylate transporter substrate binding protein n=1 Tax=unclassified Pigmentiphaga TaxID=2626614 RepID=UPI000B4181D9|nr:MULTISPECIES: tripartite tricarboxylate transporter substrate binding protein [unclassified Pigmentiphaga]MDH2235411.1 tripartite tricarboxylate transporter substrate binding protein [Pigmentiphaga sp. GD03639]OVZ66322.1 receptor [Pigmentiphaga sp. NML030171]
MPVLRPALLAVAMLAAYPAAHAQSDYPTKPVRVLVGSPPGAPSDMVARVLAERLGSRFKQTFVVENRAGANNGLAAQQVAKAAPDGYTLLVTPDTVVTVNPFVYKKMDFDPRTDLVPVSLVANFNQMMVCGAALKLTSMEQLITRARQTPMTYASGGQGSPGHLAAELVLSKAGVAMTHVPYKGPSPAMTDVMGGQVDCGFLATPTVLPNVQAGRLTALAVSSARPSPMAPTVPTLPQVGLPNIDASFNQYLMAPKDTPAAVLQALQEAVTAALQEAPVRQRLTSLDLTPVGQVGAQAAETLKRDTAKWAEVVKRIDIKE